METPEAAKRHVVLSVDPPNLRCFLPLSVKERSIALFDLEADSKSDDALRLDIDIGFNSVTIQDPMQRLGLKSALTRTNFYVGTTGAEIVASFSDGARIDGYTLGQELAVDHENSVVHKRSSSFSFSPTIKVKNVEGAEVEVSAGELSRDADVEIEQKAKFKSGERPLNAVDIGGAVKWQLASPRGEKVVHDYVYGNLHLYVECSWARRANGTPPDKRGEVTLRPTDITFFNHERRPATRVQSMLMHFALWLYPEEIAFPDAVKVSFVANVQVGSSK